MVVLKFNTLDSALTPSVFYFSWNRNVSFSSYVSPELAPSTLSFNQHFDKKKHFDRTSFKHKRSSLPLLLISGCFTSSILPWLDADSNQTKRGNFWFKQARVVLLVTCPGQSVWTHFHVLPSQTSHAHVSMREHQNIEALWKLLHCVSKWFMEIIGLFTYSYQL